MAIYAKSHAHLNGAWALNYACVQFKLKFPAYFGPTIFCKAYTYMYIIYNKNV